MDRYTGCHDITEIMLKTVFNYIQLRKHCEKRRNCLLQAISSFLTMFSTAIYLLCGNGLSDLPNCTSTKNPEDPLWCKSRASVSQIIHLTTEPLRAACFSREIMLELT